MYLSRIELRAAAGRTPEFWKQLASLTDVHQIAWSWFDGDPDRERDFLYRHEGEGLATRFYTLSKHEPVDRTGLWDIASKPFAPKLSPGERLQFSLRVNPTRRKLSGPDRGKRVDVVMDAKVAARAEIGTSRPHAEIVEATCVEWLKCRADAHGFELDDRDVRTDGYRVVRFPRGESRHDATVTMVDFDGRITVRDPSRFVASIIQGLGPAKAFGCGLMLIRRV